MAYLFGNWRPWVLRRLENIVVCHRLRKSSALPIPYFLRAHRRKQLSTVSASLTRRFDQVKSGTPFGCIRFCFFVKRDSKGKRYRANFRWTFATVEDRARSSRENRVPPLRPKNEDFPCGSPYFFALSRCTDLDTVALATWVRILRAERVEFTRKRQA